MIITREYLLKGLPTCIKGSQFLHTESYVTPFLSQMEEITDNIIINAVIPEQTYGIANVPPPVFNTVWVQAILPQQEGFSESYTLVYSLDMRTPVYKYYKGWIDSNGSLIVPNRDFILSDIIIPGEKIPYDINRLLNADYDIKGWEDSLKHEILNRHLFLGYLIELSMSGSVDYETGHRVMLAHNLIIKAYKESYLFKEPDTVSYLDYYKNASFLLSQDQDFLNMSEKTTLFKSMIDDYLIQYK